MSSEKHGRGNVWLADLFDSSALSGCPSSRLRVRYDKEQSANVSGRQILPRPCFLCVKLNPLVIPAGYGKAQEGVHFFDLFGAFHYLKENCVFLRYGDFFVGSHFHVGNLAAIRADDSRCHLKGKKTLAAGLALVEAADFGIVRYT